MSARLFAALRLPVLAALTLVLAAPATAATTPPGLNLRWDTCYDDGGTSNKLFACNTNTGANSLTLSFVLDAPMAPVEGMEIRMEIWSSSASLPAWWNMKDAGTCRSTALGLNTIVNPSATNCVDWSAGQSAGGIGAYTIGFSGPNMAMVLIATAVPASALAALDPDQEYFIANVTIGHAKTIGTGACAGCDVPVCIVFSQLNVTTPDIANNRRFIGGANGIESQLATWQNGLPVNPHILNIGVTGGGPRMSMDGCVLDPSTGTNRSTWGSVKSLYR